MSLRLLLGIVLLVIALVQTLRRPFYGVLANIIVYHVRLEVFGTGLEDLRFQFVLSLALVISYFAHKDEILQDEKEPVPPAFMLLWLFMFNLVLVTMNSVVDVGVGMEGVIELGKVALFVYLIYRIVQTEEELKILFWVIIFCLAYVGFMARWGVEWDIIDYDEVGLPKSGTGIHLMLYFSVILILLTNGNKWEKLGCAVALPLVLDFMAVTKEGRRMTLVMFLTVIFLFFLLPPKRIRLRALAGVALAGGLFVFVLTPADYWDYAYTILHPTTEHSARSRFVINAVSRRILMDYPLGVGYKNYKYLSPEYLDEEWVDWDTGARAAHNTYYATACETGIQGFLAWLGMFFFSWLRVHRIRKDLKRESPPSRLLMYASALEIGIPGIALGIYTHDAQDMDGLFWTIALSAILWRLYQRRLREEDETKLEELETEREGVHRGRSVRLNAPPTGFRSAVEADNGRSNAIQHLPST